MKPTSNSGDVKQISGNSASQALWNAVPVGSKRSQAEIGSRQFFIEAEAYRYEYEAPWIPRVFEFSNMSGMRVLELGVGLGIDASKMIASGAQYTGVDVTEKHLELSARNLKDRGLQGQFIKGDIMELPLDDHSFDIVYSFGVLHHIPHEIDILERLHLLLKPGGLLKIAVYSKFSFFNIYMVARWLLLGQFLRCPLDAYRSTISEGSPIDAPVVIRIRSKAEVLRLVQGRFDLVRYDKKGFVQGNLPLIGRRLKPDGRILNAFGRLLGWYHVLILRPK
jgi:2-polyprenyl-3-methyl-5-hydroxy-6-metoxy-1,4-benzoquinol methylase